MLRLDRKKWYSFQDLMMSPEVDRLADERRSDMTPPDWMDRLMVVLGLCQMAGPDEVSGGDGQGLFYTETGHEQRALGWTFHVTDTGGGLTIAFYLNGSDPAEMESCGDEFDTVSEGLITLLASSVWRPINAE